MQQFLRIDNNAWILATEDELLLLITVHLKLTAQCLLCDDSPKVDIWEPLMNTLYIHTYIPYRKTSHCEQNTNAALFP